jgi:DNA polymerase-3 subunit delta'
MRPLPAGLIEQPQADAFLAAIRRSARAAARGTLSLFGGVDEGAGDAVGRNVPALLFTGPEGTGREYTAIEFARSLCCERDTACDLASDDVCPSCLQMSLLEHPGLHLIYPTPTQGSGEGDDGDVTDIAKILDEKRQDIFAKYRFSKKASVRVARARATIQQAAGKPFESPYDIFIFNDAHAMREEAQNALLKLVEEPAPHVVVIFITSNPEGILYTIRSRCQRIRFLPLSTAVIENILTGYYDADAKTAHRAAAMAQGSIVRAREMVESFDDNERDAAAAFVAGLSKEGEAWAIGQALVMGRGANREGVARFLDEVSLVFRDIMTGDPELYVNRDIAESLEKLSERWPQGRLPGVIDRIARARGDILLGNAAIDAALAECFLDVRRHR